MLAGFLFVGLGLSNWLYSNISTSIELIAKKRKNNVGNIETKTETERAEDQVRATIFLHQLPISIRKSQRH